ncbi:MAG: c-type cytochrome [Gammaproteobacteria bacterium]
MLTSIEYPHQRICSTKPVPGARRAVKSIAAIPLSLAALLWTGGAAMAAGAQLSKDDLMAKGEEVYNQTCAGCHQASGMGLPGSYPPLVDGAAFDAAPFVTQPLEARGFWKDGKMQLGSVKDQLETVINGIPNSRMFAFGGQLDDAEIAAVVTYVRNAWGNDSGDVVQPAQVKAAR